MEFAADTVEIKDYRDNDRVEMRIIKVRVPPGVKFEYSAGQFVMLAMEDFKLRANPELPKWTSYSIASAPHQNGILEFCLKIKETGGFTNYVRDNLRLGTKLMVKGPFGEFVNPEPLQKVIFVATGSGIAPVMGLIRNMLNNGNNSEITLIYGFRNSNYYIYKEELEKYGRNHSNFRLIPSASRAEHKWQGKRGYVQERVKELELGDAENTQTFICGNPLMVGEARKLFLDAGLKANNIKTEQWEGA